MKHEEVIEFIKKMLLTKESLTVAEIQNEIQSKVGPITQIQIQMPIKKLVEDQIIELLPDSNPKEYQLVKVEESETVPTNLKTRDLSKFTFKEHKNLGKGRLVLEVVRQFVKDKNPTIEELKEVFLDSTIKQYGVFKSLEDALLLSQDRKRYFTDEKDRIKLTDGRFICVTNQWTKDRIEAFLELVKEKTNYKIT